MVSSESVSCVSGRNPGMGSMFEFSITCCCFCSCSQVRLTVSKVSDRTRIGHRGEHHRHGPAPGECTHSLSPLPLIKSGNEHPFSQLPICQLWESTCNLFGVFQILQHDPLTESSWNSGVIGPLLAVKIGNGNSPCNQASTQTQARNL